MAGLHGNEKRTTPRDTHNSAHLVPAQPLGPPAGAACGDEQSSRPNRALGGPSWGSGMITLQINAPRGLVKNDFWGGGEKRRRARLLNGCATRRQGHRGLWRPESF